jgi:hypothetical protein
MRIFVIIAVLTLTPVTMAVHNQPSGTQDKKGAQQTNPAAPISVNCNCAAQTADGGNKPPGWHKFIAWPEGITTWAILLTLGAIVWQAVETRRAAQATVRYAEAFIESQRPIMAAQIAGNPTKDLHDRDAPRVRVSLSNKGLTTAYEVTYQSWIELLPFPFTDFTDGADHFMSENAYSVYPNHDDIILNVPIRKGLSEDQLKDLRELRLYACVRIRVAFRDAFSPSRYSNFGLDVMREGPGFCPSTTIPIEVAIRPRGKAL